MTPAKKQEIITDRRHYLKDAKKIVLKLGTKVLLSHHNDLEKKRINKLVKDIAHYRQKGFQFCIVTSGAVGFGMQQLGLKTRPTDLKKIQACASIGQSILMEKWNKVFEKNDIPIGQILLTYDIIENRQRFLYARDCIRSLFDYNTIPVVNENDSVAVDELKFGDNDNLSALTANLIDADLLVLFTDTDGLFDKNPHHNPDAQRISFIEKIDDSLFKLIDDRQNNFSLGGMTSKLKAAQNSTQAGSAVIITDGFHPDLQSLLNGDDIGTFFRPENRYRKKRKRWIFFNNKIKGKIFIDPGAEDALVNHNKSLLPGGILGTEKNFSEGSIVGIFNTEKKMIGKGITYFSNTDIEKVKGKKTDMMQEILGKKFYTEIINRDNLIIL